MRAQIIGASSRLPSCSSRPITRTPAALLAAAARPSPTERLATIPGIVPGLVRPAEGLSVRAALPIRHRITFAQRPAAPARRGRRPRGALSSIRSATVTHGAHRAGRPEGVATKRGARMSTVIERPQPRTGRRQSGKACSSRTQISSDGCRRGVASPCKQGKTLAVVGESGCGKSTLARHITMIEPPTSGTSADRRHRCRDAAGRGRARTLRQTVQLVFQNPLWLAQSAQDRRAPSLEEPLVDQHIDLERPARKSASPR